MLGPQGASLGLRFKKNERGEYLRVADLNFEVPFKFLETPFRTYPAPLGPQKFPVVLVPIAPPLLGPRRKFRRGASETLSSALSGDI